MWTTKQKTSECLFDQGPSALNSLPETAHHLLKKLFDTASKYECCCYQLKQIHKGYSIPPAASTRTSTNMCKQKLKNNFCWIPTLKSIYIFLTRHLPSARNRHVFVHRFIQVVVIACNRRRGCENEELQNLIHVFIEKNMCAVFIVVVFRHNNFWTV